MFAKTIQRLQEFRDRNCFTPAELTAREKKNESAFNLNPAVKCGGDTRPSALGHLTYKAPGKKRGPNGNPVEKLVH
jgi:hypothetical protein